MIIEPKGAEFLNPRTGAPLLSGTQAVIRTPDGRSYREFALFVHDFALLFHGEGKPLNAPLVPGSHDDPGVMGINYRCEPMIERLKYRDDPAHIFSSQAYWDPSTPILETYAGDRAVIRLLDGAHEEQHAFQIQGISWSKDIDDPDSPRIAEQTLGVSEAFNIELDQPYAPGDYLYYSGGIDDLWLGMWGVLRAYGEPNERLLPLCGSLIPAQPEKPDAGAAVRRFEIAAIQLDLKYNRYGDHDPDGLVFVPLAEVDAVNRGKMPIPPHPAL